MKRLKHVQDPSRSNINNPLTSAHLPIQLLFVSAICRWQTLMPLTSHVPTEMTVVLQALRLSQFTQ